MFMNMFIYSFFLGQKASLVYNYESLPKDCNCAPSNSMNDEELTLLREFRQHITPGTTQLHVYIRSH